MAGIKPQRREPNGRKQRPPTAYERELDQRRKKEAERMDIIGVALAHPHRRNIKQGKENPLHGFPLGRLYVSQQISSIQYRACSRYAAVTGRWYSTQGLPTGRYDSICAQMIAGPGGMSHWEPEDDDVHKAESAMNDIQRCLTDFRAPQEYRDMTKALFSVCVWGIDPNVEMLGNLRIAANLLARMWNIEDGR